MKQADVEHLAALARIELTQNELATLPSELASIVSYVSAVTDIAGDEADMTPAPGARCNIFRPDVVTNDPDQYTADLLAAMPDRDGRYLKVKKILGATD